MRRLVILITFVYLIFNASFCFALDIKTQAKVDLDGDGKLEDISISEITEAGEFLLKVDGISIRGRFNVEEAADGFIIVDIDTTDKYKEVAVHTPGPSDDDEYLIYWYDGKSVREMGRMSRWPTFVGNGIVYVDDWMGFWSKRDKYVLDVNKRILKLIPQELYYVGIEAKVIKSFPLYRTREGVEILAHLKPDSKVIILACDPSPTEPKGKKDDIDDYLYDWYLIKSETGLLGWARLKSFEENLKGLPWAD